jgi:hypothetical protein
MRISVEQVLLHANRHYPDSKEFTISAARYAQNKIAIRCPSDGTGMKTRAARLCEGLGGKWTHRCEAHILSTAAAWRFIGLIGTSADWSPITKRWEGYTVHGVRAGAYVGRASKLDHTLTHASWDHGDHAICGRVGAGNLADILALEPNAELTCPHCRSKLKLPAGQARG